MIDGVRGSCQLASTGCFVVGWMARVCCGMCDDLSSCLSACAADGCTLICTLASYHVRAAGEKVGITFNSRDRISSSYDAHRLVAMAEDKFVCWLAAIGGRCCCLAAVAVLVLLLLVCVGMLGA